MKIRRVIPPVASPIYFRDIIHGIIGIFQNKRYIKNFEDEIKKHFGVKHVFLVSSGKSAIFLILNALKSLSPGKNSVLIPAYTCFSVPSAIVKAGLKVSLCDINESTLDFAPDLLRNSINSDTLCVIPNHLFGIPSDINYIKSICNETGTYVVEDTAQAMGISLRGIKLGTQADVGFMSLGRGKNITCGSGGIIITNSDIVAEAITKHYSNIKNPDITEVLKKFCEAIVMRIFINPSLYWLPSSLPYLKLGETIFYNDFPIEKLSGMQAGLLRNWQERLELSNHIREETTRYFKKHLGMSISDIPDVPYLRLPIIMKNNLSRNIIYQLSYRDGLGISLMYPSAISDIKELKELFLGKKYPVASKIADRLVAIPTHHYLTEKDKKAICNLFKNYTISVGEIKNEAHNYN